tara:strand:+ start:221 stop:880 length:660 start_codon:yes stop_codon:yes gene_type:complete
LVIKNYFTLEYVIDCHNRKKRITKLKTLISTFVFILITINSYAGENKNHTSHYAGEQKREIKSLSTSDIAELKRGGGWGFAKSAELNGAPGPAHLLEMKKEISLSSSQVASIEKIHKKMLSEAIPLGKKYIKAERTLDQIFVTKAYNNENLLLQIRKIENIRGRLRYVHLSKHLETVKILSDNQISLYNKLRGYSETNVCDNVPEGHDAEMFRKHNGCE